MPNPRSAYEIWLRPNRRAILFGCVVPSLMTFLGIFLAARGPLAGWTTIAGWVLIVLGAIGIALLVRQSFRPRIAHRGDVLLFYLRSGAPIAVPLHVVEAFFVGQGTAALPGPARDEESANLIARVSQRHTEWAQHEVKPALGAWCGGYITIRGTWCEPLTGDVIRRINRRLKEVQTETAARAT
jgi:hypothetical protein